MKKILIAGTNSGSGKTTVSSVLMASFENVAPFKVGPDYIDPSYHELFTGNKSYNLDAFMCDNDTLKHIFELNSKDKDISIIEGVMGLYDGLGHEKDNFSTAHISRILDVPVILVVNAKGISTSIAAKVLGFKEFDKNVNIKGVILNNVSSEKLYLNLKEVIEKYTGIECVGYIPRNEKLMIENRHLGLKQAFELNGSEDLAGKIKLYKKIGQECLDLEKINKIAIDFESSSKMDSFEPIKALKNKYKGKKIAIAKDMAFSFYYNSNIDLIRYSGLEIVEFSPIKDKKLPEDVSIIYFGGGYPELYAKELSENKNMIESIKEASKNGVKMYAECGGFIYLTKRLNLLDGQSFDFVNIFDIEISMKNKLNIGRFGYIDIECKEENDQRANIKIKGHEFHYSEIMSNNEVEKQRTGNNNGINKEQKQNYFYNITKNDGRIWNCGYRKNSVLAGYPHIMFYSNIDFFRFIIEKL